MEARIPKGTRLTINGIEVEILEELSFKTNFSSEAELAENLSLAKLLPVVKLKGVYGAGGKLILDASPPKKTKKKKV